MLSDPALELLHEYPDEGLQIIPVVDRRVIPITVDTSVELVSASRLIRSNVWSSARQRWTVAAALHGQVLRQLPSRRIRENTERCSQVMPPRPRRTVLIHSPVSSP